MYYPPPDPPPKRENRNRGGLNTNQKSNFVTLFLLPFVYIFVVLKHTKTIGYANARQKATFTESPKSH